MALLPLLAGTQKGAGLAAELPRAFEPRSYEIGRSYGWWSGFDIRAPPSRGLATRMAKPKLHQNGLFAGGPLIPTFAKEPAERGCECWNRSTSSVASSIDRTIPRALPSRYKSNAKLKYRGVRCA